MGGGKVMRYDVGGLAEEDRMSFERDSKFSDAAMDAYKTDFPSKTEGDRIEALSRSGADASVLQPPVIRAPEGPTKRKPTSEEIERALEGLDIPEEDRTPKKKKKKKKSTKKNMGGTVKYNKGGKVRGCGIASQGVRKAKMVSMKGS